MRGVAERSDDGESESMYSLIPSHFTREFQKSKYHTMAQYDDFAQTFSTSRQHMRWPEIDYLLGKLDFSSDLRILDAWCGNGRLLDHLGEQKLEYVGIDNSDKMLDEARKFYPTKIFFLLDMNLLDKIVLKDFNAIFFIASFHHLEDDISRKAVLKKTAKLLKPGGIILMTNWNLLWEKNMEKYGASKILWSENEFGWADFQIKIWEFKRFYHSFTHDEIQHLFRGTWLIIEENVLFPWENNIITIARKQI